MRQRVRGRRRLGAAFGGIVVSLVLACWTASAQSLPGTDIPPLPTPTALPTLPTLPTLTALPTVVPKLPTAPTLPANLLPVASSPGATPTPTPNPNPNPHIELDHARNPNADAGRVLGLPISSVCCHASSGPGPDADGLRHPGAVGTGRHADIRFAAGPEHTNQPDNQPVRDSRLDPGRLGRSRSRRLSAGHSGDACPRAVRAPPAARPSGNPRQRGGRDADSAALRERPDRDDPHQIVGACGSAVGPDCCTSPAADALGGRSAQPARGRWPERACEAARAGSLRSVGRDRRGPIPACGCRRSVGGGPEGRHHRDEPRRSRPSAPQALRRARRRTRR